MTYLITGGAGFIGSNFIHYMLREHLQDNIICLDALTYAGNLNSLVGAFENDQFTFIKGDIACEKDVNTVFERERPDMVINFAAESPVDRSIQDSQAFLKTNVYGTQVLLGACKKYTVRRFHQISTDEVYGDLPTNRPDLRFTESSPLKPSNPYSASKASADLFTLAYARTYSVPISISRCSNNYGTFQHPEKLIPLMILNAKEDKPLPVYGTGENVRDWIHVEDHCRAVDLILHHEGAEGQVYNIGGGSEVRNIDVVKAILRAMDKPKTLITYIKDRPGHDRRYAVDSSKLENELGWKPEIAFSKGLKETVRWYLKQTTWLEEIKQPTQVFEIIRNNDGKFSICTDRYRGIGAY